MSFFRTLLWWLLLAAFGALALELFSVDLGEVLIRWHGTTITTTVAFWLLAWGLLWFAAWALWTVLSLPFTAWQRLAQAQARNRLINGLVALTEGRNARAGNLLEKAAEDSDAALVAQLFAREAALRRGDALSATSSLSSIADLQPGVAAVISAETLLAQGKAQAALDLLQPFADRKQLSPRGVFVRAQALVAAVRAAESVGLLGLLASEQALSAEELARHELLWHAHWLQQSTHANQLQQTWAQLPAALCADEAIVLAYARRAGELGLEHEAATVLADAIERQWSETLVDFYSLLPPPREDGRLARAEQWLAAHATSPALALCLGRLCVRARQLGAAEEVLHRAIALGVGAAAWEELGQVYTLQNEPGRAQACYANALRSLRGEPTRPLDGRSLREQIADEAVAEQRDEHGLPHLRAL